MSVRQIPWRQENKNRPYPLVTGLDHRSSNGQFYLPDEFLTWIEISVPSIPGFSPDGVFISRVKHSADLVTLDLSYQATPQDVPQQMGTTSISKGAFDSARVVQFLLMGEYLGGRVEATFGDLTFAGQPFGEYSFTADGTRIEMDSVRIIDDARFAGLTLVQGDRVDNTQGPLTFVAGDNVRLRIDTSDDYDAVVVVDVIDADGLNRVCQCGNDLGERIYSINGVPPADDGSFEFLPVKCVDLFTLNEAVFIQNLCGEPCCGCDELELITGALDPLRQEVLDLLRQLEQLEENVDILDEAIRPDECGAAAIGDPPPTTTTQPLVSCDDFCVYVWGVDNTWELTSNNCDGLSGCECPEPPDYPGAMLYDKAAMRCRPIATTN